MSDKNDTRLYRILTGKILREGFLVLAGLFFFAAPALGQVTVGREARQLVEAYHALWQAQPAEAVLALEGLLATHPEDPALMMTLAEALLALGQDDQAQSYADRAVALNTSDPELGLSAYLLALQRSDLAGANARLQTLIARFPTHPEIVFTHAEHLWHDGQAEEARALWLRVREMSAVWGPPAEARLRETAPRRSPANDSPTGDFSLARAQHLLNQHPDQPEAYLRVAFAAWAESPTARIAEDALEDMALIFGDHPVARLGTVWRHVMANQLGEAEALIALLPAPEAYADAFAFARAVLNRLRGGSATADEALSGDVLAARGLAPPPNTPLLLRLQGP